MPDGNTFTFYESAIECRHHNNILSDQKQLKILVRYNFDKFVRALETIGKPTAATTQYDYNTCMSSISPFSEIDDEDSESDSDSDFEVEHNGNEEHGQSADEMSPFSESCSEEGGSGSDSDYEDKCSEKEQHDQSADEITDDEEEIYCMEKEDDDVKLMLKWPTGSTSLWSNISLQQKSVPSYKYDLNGGVEERGECVLEH